jgi:hypothetical protein
MNTTIFLPMPEWQALSFLRNRKEAFARLLTPAGNHHACELVMSDDALFGFKQRADAVEVGKRVYPHGFAMVRFNVLGKMLNGMMTLQRSVVGVTDSSTGKALWRVSREALVQINDKVDSGDTEILVDQIFGGDADHDADRCPAAPTEEVDRGFLEDGGRPVGFVSRNREVLGSGPTGFGGC